MKNCNILVIGNFGFKTDNINGQTQRTRNIFLALTQYSNLEIKIIDTSFGMVEFIRNFFLILNAGKIVILPAQRAISPLLLILFILGKMSVCSIVVIGGWLPRYIDKKKYLINLLKKLNQVFVQTDSMVNSLNNRKLTNVSRLDNFRLYSYDYIIDNQKKINETVKLIFYARVDETKGIEILLDAMKHLDKERYILDIYGPIKEDYLKRFNDLISMFENVYYHGIIREHQLFTIGNYDIMIFPTHYDGEGFPGTILEAIYSGVPVIASDWLYNKEIIEKYKCGLLFEPFSSEQLANVINELANNQLLYNDFVNNCIEATNELDPSRIISNFLNIILN